MCGVFFYESGRTDPVLPYIRQILRPWLRAIRYPHMSSGTGGSNEQRSLESVASAMAAFQSLRDAQFDVFARHVALEARAGLDDSVDFDDDSFLAEQQPHAFAESDASDAEVSQLHAAVAHLAGTISASLHDTASLASSATAPQQPPHGAAFLVRVTGGAGSADTEGGSRQQVAPLEAGSAPHAGAR